MLYKFVDKDTVERERNPLWLGDTVISNPDEETLRAHGYTDLIEASVMPEVEDGYMLVPQYALNEDGTIIQTYRTEVIPDEPV